MKQSEQTKPAPRSVYRKLRLVLETARRHSSRTLDELTEAVSRTGDAEFTRYGRREGGEVGLLNCSLASVRRVVMLAHVLKFVNDEGGLTSAGIRVLSDKNTFDAGVSQAIVRNLKAIGVEMDELNARIREGLGRATPDSLPTLDNILSFASVSEASPQTIRVYFQLLSAAGGIRTVRKKLFLPTRARG